MIRKFCYLIMLIIIVSGCAEISYVRSDAFIDPELVKVIYVMPITEEVTIDSDLKKSRDELKAELREARVFVKHIIEEQFKKRGYALGGYSKDFSELDKNDPNDALIRDAIFEFLKPSEAKPMKFVQKKKDKEDSAEIEYFLESETESKEESLIDRVITCVALFPKGTDTVLFLNIKSHIAKKTFWNSNIENNGMSIAVKMISLSRRETILSYNRHYEGKNILEHRQLKLALDDILRNIPVKL